MDTNEKLTVKQELFCNNYIKNEYFRGNATLSYIDAYEIDLDSKSRIGQKDEDGHHIHRSSDYERAYDNASASASRLLRNVKIQEENRRLLNEMLTDEVIDSRLSEIILKGRDTDSLNAIKEYNKLKSRIIERRAVEVQTKELTDEEQELVNNTLKANGLINEDTNKEDD